MVDLAGSGASRGPKVEKLERERISGDRSPDARDRDTLGASAAGDMQVWRREGRERRPGNAPVKVPRTNARGSITRRRGHDNLAGLITSQAIADHQSEQTLEVDVPGAGAIARWQELGANGEEGRDGDESALLAGGRKPLKRNPGRGSGMKQARKVVGGENRRGREQRRGRTEGRAWEPWQTWTPGTEVAKRDETPRQALDVATRRAGDNRNVSEGEASSREDAPLS